MPEIRGFRVTTLNVRGLKMADRRRAFFESLRSCRFDVMFLQECHLEGGRDEAIFSEECERGPSVWGAGNVKADGVGILFNSQEFHIEGSAMVVPGRVLYVDVRWRGVRVRFINVYAPSKREDRRGFFNCLNVLFFTNRKVFLGGDFNVSLDRESKGELASLIKSFSFRDSFKVAGGASDGFTWRNSRGEASRLDYVFVSAGVEVEQFFMLPVWLSDHCMVGVEVEVGGLERGRGSWRLNRSFLQDENFCQVIRHLYRAWQSFKGLFASRALWWEGVKERMAIFCRWWGRAKAAKRRELIKGWNREMQVLWNNEGSGAAGVGGRFYEIQGKVKDFYMKEAEKFMVEMGRRRRWLEEGPSKFFVRWCKETTTEEMYGDFEGREWVCKVDG